MKLRDANLQVNEKISFTHPPSCILPSFFKNTSRLFLPKSLWKCASTISFRNISELPAIYLLNYYSSKSKFSWVQFLSNKLELICFLQCKDYKNILLFALRIMLCVLICNFLSKRNCSPSWGYKFLFYFDICNKFILSLIICDNISRDVYFFMLKR